MDEIFKFATIRPPEAISLSKVATVTKGFVYAYLDEFSPFFVELDSFLRTNDSEKVIQRSQEFMESDDFASAIENAFNFINLGKWLRSESSVNPSKFSSKIQEIFSKNESELISSEDYKKIRINIANGILALIFDSKSRTELNEKLNNIMRIFGLIEQLHYEEKKLENNTIKKIIEKPISVIFPKTTRPTDTSSNPINDKNNSNFYPTIFVKIKDLKQALEEIQEKGNLEPESHTLNDDTKKEKVKRLIDFINNASSPEEISNHFGDDPNFGSSTNRAYGVRKTVANRILIARNNLQGKKFTTIKQIEKVKGVGEDTIHDMKNIVTNGKQEIKISSETKEILEKNQIKLSDDYGIVKRKIQSKLVELSRHLTNRNGGKILIGRTPIDKSELLEFTKETSIEALSIEGHISREKIRPVGILDLMITNQELLGYEKGEIAHIENVLKGELKERSHRRLNKVEETIDIETESEQEAERELESTNRYELQQESSNVINQETQTDIGISATGGWGPISISTDFRQSQHNSVERSNKNATTIAQEITERAVSRIKERLKEQRTVTTTTEFEETNMHRLNNENGDDHVVGIYRWVDKRYKAQVQNYGKRLMFEFLVPEPASFLIWRKIFKPTDQEKIEKIEPPMILVTPSFLDTFDNVLHSSLENNSTISQPSSGVSTPKTGIFAKRWRALEASDLDESTYVDYVSRYGVSDVSPPPPNELVQAITYKVPKGIVGFHNKEIKIKIPSGYKAKRAKIRGILTNFINEPIVVKIKTDDDGKKTREIVDKKITEPLAGDEHIVHPTKILFIAIGDGVARNIPNHKAEFNLSGEEGEIPVVITTYADADAAIAIEIICETNSETGSAFQEWQIRTFNSIMQAYERINSEQEERIAAQEIQEGIAIAGTNPLQNRETEKTELKKGIISLLTGRNMDFYKGGVSHSGISDIPKIDFSSTEKLDHYIRFFENSFEWKNITYDLHPYYWSDRIRWQILQKIEDEGDPLFAKFLKAGAATVRIAAKRGFEKQILYFLSFWNLWMHQDEPSTLSEEFMPLIPEIEQIEDLENNEPKEVGKPWELKIPTSLVMLQKDNDDKKINFL